MNFQEKATVLQSLDTKRLIDQLHELEAKLEQSLIEDLSFRNMNSQYMSTIGSDCAEVKRILADLRLNAPSKEDSKKMTVDEREAWLIGQRSISPLSDAIEAQEQLVFVAETNRISIEMARKRLDDIRSVLALKTAQIRFLTGDDQDGKGATSQTKMVG